MKIQILSDLHLESPKGYSTFQIPPQAPYLALLGDIGNVVHHKDEYLAFLTAQLRQFRAPETISVLRDFEEDNQQRRISTDDASQLGEFVLLERGVFRPPDSPEIAILGCSLFSHVPPESYEDVSIGLQNFYGGVGTSDWDVDTHNAAHRRDLDWLNEQVALLGREKGVEKVVILTHWTPTRDGRSIHPQYRGEDGGSNSKIESGFSTDLSEEVCFRSGKVRVWAFGHTHFNCDFVVGRGEVDNGRGLESLRLVANQRGGYFRQAARFDVGKVVEL